jgi:hypothetical protein
MKTASASLSNHFNQDGPGKALSSAKPQGVRPCQSKAHAAPRFEVYPRFSERILVWLCYLA